MNTSLYYFIIICCLNDGTDSLTVKGSRNYTVKGTKYTVDGIFEENGVPLTQRFTNLLEASDNVLTESETGVTINTEYVSAVGKDENEKDSK